jgi:Kef-type K+ transport system membrane component KefB
VEKAPIIGLLSFFLPFFLCAALADGIWMDARSQLAGRIAMSTTSVAVVRVMLELGINTSGWENGPAACFVTDLATVIALGLIFALYAQNRRIYRRHGGGGFLLPWLTPVSSSAGDRPSELEAKF